MGNPTACNAIVVFDTEQDCFKAFEAFDAFVKQAVKNTFTDPELQGEYDIYDLDYDSTQFTYTVSSNREVNCEWQCERIRDFLKKQPGVKEIYQPIMSYVDSIDWNKSDEPDENNSGQPETSV